MTDHVSSTAPPVADGRAAHRLPAPSPPRTRIGLGILGYYGPVGGLQIVRWARLAEQLGFDDIWLPDHVTYRVPIGDAQVMAGMAAAATDTLQVCTGVIQAPLRHPLVLAKWLGSLAHEIPGRVVAGLGVGGDFRPEWQRLGIDPGRRGRMFDEVLEVLPRLLANESVSHRGEFYEFDVEPLFGSAPEPIPIWVGARLDGAIRRAALVDGWLGMLRWPEEFAAQRAQVRHEAERIGRPAPATGISIAAAVLGSEAEARERCAEFYRSSYGLPVGRGERRAVGGIPALRELVNGYRAAGAERISIAVLDPPDEAWPLVAAACLDDR